MVTAISRLEQPHDRAKALSVALARDEVIDERLGASSAGSVTRAREEYEVAER